MSREYELTLITAINQLAESCNGYATKNGFWKDEDELIKATEGSGRMQQRILSLFNSEKIALEMSELAERLETLRKDPTKLDEHCSEFFNVEIEVADLIIRALDFAGRRKLRIGEAILAKMKYNEGRPYKHGKIF